MVKKTGKNIKFEDSFQETEKIFLWKKKHCWLKIKQNCNCFTPE